MKKLQFFILLLFCTVAITAQQPKPTHTGTWWKDKSGLYKEAFVSGYKLGAHHAIGHDTDLTPFGVTELVAGVDTFYKDFRNRNIVFSDAIGFVSDQLRGIPDDKLNAELLKMRAAAAGNSTAGMDDAP